LAELEQTDDNGIYRWLFGSDAAVSHHSCVAGLASGPTSRHFTRDMIKEISQRIYSAAAVCLWVVVVAGTSAIILASTVNGGISW
jgi:hypothetical protein